MPTKREAKYAKALDELDAQRSRGAVSSNAYEIERARLIKEASKQGWNWGWQLLIVIGLILLALVLLRIAGAFVRAVNGT